MRKEINEEYDLMDENEKFALRYGAEGRHIGDVVRDSPGGFVNSEKMFDAWNKGINMRKDGSSKAFPDDIDKAELERVSPKKDETIDSNGILAEPVSEIKDNDFSDSFSWGNAKGVGMPPQKVESKISETKNIQKDEERDSSPIKEEYLLQPNEKYDTIYLSNYSNKVPSGKTEDGKAYVTYGCEDVNVVGGIQSRLKEMSYKGKDGTSIKITGIFDADTEEGIRQFQKDRDLPVTGILDEATKKEMGFSEDYSVSRSGRNATPWHHPTSPPFNLERYNRELKEYEEEKKQRAKEDEKADAFSFVDFIMLLGEAFAKIVNNAPQMEPVTVHESMAHEDEDDALLEPAWPTNMAEITAQEWAHLR